MHTHSHTCWCDRQPVRSETPWHTHTHTHTLITHTHTHMHAHTHMHLLVRQAASEKQDAVIKVSKHAI